MRALQLHTGQGFGGRAFWTKGPSDEQLQALLISRECNTTQKPAIAQHLAREPCHLRAFENEADVEAVLAPIWFQRFMGVDAVAIERLTAQDSPNDSMPQGR